MLATTIDSNSAWNYSANHGRSDATDHCIVVPRLLPSLQSGMFGRTRHGGSEGGLETAPIVCYLLREVVNFNMSFVHAVTKFQHLIRIFSRLSFHCLYLIQQEACFTNCNKWPRGFLPLINSPWGSNQLLCQYNLWLKINNILCE